MKNRVLMTLAVMGCFIASAANTTPMTYELTVAGGGWVSVGTPSFGLSDQPTLKGWLTVDNELTGLDAFKYFSFTTGAHTWTLSEFVGPSAVAFFDTSGYLSQFSLALFTFGATSMYFHSHYTTSIYTDTSWFFCNSCISFEPGELHQIPEPAMLGLIGVGLLCIGYTLRKSNGAASRVRRFARIHTVDTHQRKRGSRRNESHY